MPTSQQLQPLVYQRLPSYVGMIPWSASSARKQLNPYEEAKAVRAMLDRGLTEDGAARALG